jgi:hypothetical protein
VLLEQGRHQMLARPPLKDSLTKLAEAFLALSSTFHFSFSSSFEATDHPFLFLPLFEGKSYPNRLDWIDSPRSFPYPFFQLLPV